MACCCCCCGASGERVLPTSEESEQKKFEELLAEDVGAKNPNGWQMKTEWPQKWVNEQFKMRVLLRKHESGNPNKLLRADGKYKGVVPEDFLGFLLNPENLPGLQEWKDVETLPDGYIKYCRVKAGRATWNKLVFSNFSVFSN